MGFRKTWVLIGTSPLEAGQRPLERLNQIGVQVIHDTVTAIDPKARAAEVGGRRIEADALAVSVLPNALFYELLGDSPGWLKWAKMGVLTVMAVLAYFWKEVRPLRNFFLIVLAIFLAEEVAAMVRASALWQGWFGKADAPFAASTGAFNWAGCSSR